jgi:uroporphyrin-III C-methyltransferase
MAHLVAIVGAGPGDPELLTLKALKLIQQADYILYDALVSEEILRLARTDAQCIYVGKVYHDGQDQSERQDQINQLILDLAARGRIIVRLKSGDPMIFGRGAEEIRFCKKNNLNYKVVPGITSALGAASIFGIPLTQRGKNSTVLFGTGHYCEGEFCDLDSFVSVLKSGSPIIMYMGLNKLIHLATTLVENGIAADVSVQILCRVSQPGQQAFETSLGGVGALLSSEKPPMPALIIIGEHVGRLR